jgi:hypothetical protein
MMLVGHPSTPRINNRNAYSPSQPTRPHLRQCRRRGQHDLRSRGTASPETRVRRSVGALLEARTGGSMALGNRNPGRTTDRAISGEVLRVGQSNRQRITRPPTVFDWRAAGGIIGRSIWAAMWRGAGSRWCEACGVRDDRCRGVDGVVGDARRPRCAHRSRSMTVRFMGRSSLLVAGCSRHR